MIEIPRLARQRNAHPCFRLEMTRAVHGEREVARVRYQIAELGTHDEADEGRGRGGGKADFGAVGREENVGEGGGIGAEPGCFVDKDGRGAAAAYAAADGHGGGMEGGVWDVGTGTGTGKSGWI